MVDVSWSATSPHSGRFDAVVTRTEVDALNERFAALRTRVRATWRLGGLRITPS